MWVVAQMGRWTEGQMDRHDEAKSHTEHVSYINFESQYRYLMWLQLVIEQNVCVI